MRENIIPFQVLSIRVHLYSDICTLCYEEGTEGKEPWPWHSNTSLLSQYYFNIESMLLHGRVKQLLFGCKPRFKCLGKGQGKLFCILVMLPEGKLTKQMGPMTEKDINKLSYVSKHKEIGAFWPVSSLTTEDKIVRRFTQTLHFVPLDVIYNIFFFKCWSHFQFFMIAK